MATLQKVTAGGRRLFLWLTGVTLLLVFLLALYGYPQQRRMALPISSLLQHMYQTYVQQREPPSPCSSFLQRAGSMPDLSLAFKDHPSLERYPASLAPQINGHFLSEEEVDCLEGARDWMDVASPNLSPLTLLGGRSKFVLGSEVRVRVDVYTRGGTRKRQGGDGLRIWLRDTTNNASVAGYVVDLLNGSYVGVLRALWVGTPEVVVALATPLEQIKWMYHLYATRGTMREIKWRFVNNKGKSALDWCFPYDLSALKAFQHTEMCNLTGENYGNEWFCRKPANFSCQEGRGLAYQRGYGPLPKSALLKSLLSSFHKTFKQRLKIAVVAKAKESVIRATTPCHQRPWGQTFLDTAPAGFFHRGAWHLRHCRDVRGLQAPQPAKYRPCLQNRTFYFLGDSTMRFLSDYLTKRLELKTRREGLLQISDKAAWNFSLVFTCHGLPYHGGAYKPLPYFLDKVPSHTRGLVFLTVYLHISSFHPRGFRGRARNIAQAVGRLVQRAPNVQIAVRGCHAFHSDNWDHAIAHDDHWGKLYDRVWKKELFPWRDRVLFLDTWDMTVAGENFDMHPPPSPYLDAIMQSLLAYTCKV